MAKETKQFKILKSRFKSQIAELERNVLDLKETEHFLEEPVEMCCLRINMTLQQISDEFGEGVVPRYAKVNDDLYPANDIEAEMRSTY